MDSELTFFIYLAVVLASAKLGAEIFARVRQPAVLGELVMGVLLGSITLVMPSWTFFEPLRTPGGAQGMQAIAAVGVVLILFEAGLETTVTEMRRVGVSSILVAIAGVCIPFALGYLCSMLLVHEVPAVLLAKAPNFPLVYVHVFIGATLSATSVGITARVFKDLGVSHLLESRIVLGAAVIDDVLGLVLLAIVNGMIVNGSSGTELSWGSIAWLCFTALIFLAGAIAFGLTIVPRFMKSIARFRTSGVMLTGALVICFSFSAIAEAIGLAAIVGAFAAGLIFEEVHFEPFAERRTIHDLISPIVAFVSPVFFVLIGMQVHLDQFFHADVLLLGSLLAIAAIAGKLVCGWMVRERPARRSIVAFGMIPRGEVGLILAGIGKATGVIGDNVFAALIFVVVVTTFITPILLSRTILARSK